MPLAFLSPHPHPHPFLARRARAVTPRRSTPLPRLRVAPRCSLPSDPAPRPGYTPDYTTPPPPSASSAGSAGAIPWTGAGSPPPPTPPGGAGGAGGSGEDGDAPREAELAALLSEKGVPLGALHADVLAAYRARRITLSHVANYLAASANALSRLLLRAGPGMRSRFLADRLFLLKILIEEGIGVFGKLSAEWEQRRANFFAQGEFVFANLVTAVLADFALVYLPAPSVALSNVSGGGLGAWVQGLARTLPSNVFQTDRPFTLAQRAAGYALKGGQLFAVGMMCCFAGVVVTNSLVFVREKLDPQYRPLTQKQNPLLVSLLYATFLGLSSGTRYQLVNGVESHVFPRVFARAPRVAEEAATFVLRYANTFWGSQQWVMFCRFTNVQKVKPAE